MYESILQNLKHNRILYFSTFLVVILLIWFYSEKGCITMVKI